MNISSSLISVIMPVRNVEEYISFAIQSILDQSYRNFELIIINDGSTDNTENKIMCFTDERIRYFNRVYLGIAEQLNYGLEISKGYFIARMDGDDLSHSERLMKQYNFLQKNINIHAVGTNYFRINKQGKILFKKVVRHTTEECKFTAPLNTPILHATLFTYKKVFDDVGRYKSEYETIEDYELFNRMIKYGYNLTNLNEHLYYYRLNKNLVNSPREKKQQRLIYKYGKEFLLDRIKESNSRLFTPVYQLALLEYYLGNVKAARGYFLRAFKLKPKIGIKILRYLPLTILGQKIVSYLRNKKILYNINIFVNTKFKIDLKRF